MTDHSTPTTFERGQPASSTDSLQRVGRALANEPESIFRTIRDLPGVRSWKILNDLAFLLLSGVLGMVSLQALAMFVYAFGGGWLYAAAVAVLLFVSGVATGRALDRPRKVDVGAVRDLALGEIYRQHAGGKVGRMRRLRRDSRVSADAELPTGTAGADAPL